MKKTDIIKLALSGKTSEEIKNLIELETLLDIPDDVAKTTEEEVKETTEEVKEKTEEDKEEKEVDEEKEALKTEVTKLKEDILKMQQEFKNSDISSNEDVDILTKAQERLDALVKNYM